MLRLLRFVLVVAVLLSPSSAFATMLKHYDLGSLAFEAEAIVRAREIATREGDAWTTIRTLQITHSYKGDLSAGSVIELSYGTYSFSPRIRDAAIDAGPPPKLGDEVVLFLRRYGRGVDAGRKLGLVPSGLRIFLDGKAHRFVQQRNPGGYSPVPQRHDPFDLYDDPRAGEVLDLAGLEAEIEKGQRRANDAVSAIAEPDGPERRRRLLALCGRALTEPPIENLRGSYDDVVAKNLVEALAKTGDLGETLEGLARATTLGTFSLHVPFEITRLLEAAADGKQPLPIRLAALDLVDGKSFDLRATPRAEAKILALIDDPSPDIRVAALALNPTETPTAQRKAAILARWKIESDNRVRLAIFDAARQLEMADSLAAFPGEQPIVHARRSRDKIMVAWADLTDTDLLVKSAIVVARSKTLPERRTDAWKSDASYRNGASGDATMHLVFEPPLPPGDVELEMSVVLQDLKHRRPDTTRTFALGTMRIEPSVARAASTMTAGGASKPAVSPPRSSSCHCDLATAQAPGSAWLIAALGAILVVRRKRLLDR